MEDTYKDTADSKSNYKPIDIERGMRHQKIGTKELNHSSQNEIQCCFVLLAQCIENGTKAVLKTVEENH